MTLRKLLSCLLCCCLLLTLSGCGNKGPLVLDEEEKQERRQSREY